VLIDKAAASVSLSPSIQPIVSQREASANATTNNTSNSTTNNINNNSSNATVPSTEALRKETDESETDEGPSMAVMLLVFFVIFLFVFFCVCCCCFFVRSVCQLVLTVRYEFVLHASPQRQHCQSQSEFWKVINERDRIPTTTECKNWRR
jgi:hypothetical protein